MLLRLINLLLLGYLIYVLIKFARRSRGAGGRQAAGKDVPAEDLVRDPYCGSYVPRGEAVASGDHFFCSEKCARLFLGRS